MRKVRDQPRTTREELVNDLKAVGAKVTMQSIGNTLRCNEMTEMTEILQRPQGPPAQESTCTSPANEHLMIQRRLGRMFCGQMRPKLSSLASTQLENKPTIKMINPSFLWAKWANLQNQQEIKQLFPHCNHKNYSLHGEHFNMPLKWGLCLTLCISGYLI